MYTLCGQGSPVTTVPQKDSETISFRMSGPLLAQLTELATALGASRGEYAKNVLIAALQDEHRLQMLDDMRALRANVERLRSDVATSLEAVLLNIGKIDEGQVQEFISKNLRR